MGRLKISASLRLIHVAQLGQSPGAGLVVGILTGMGAMASMAAWLRRCRRALFCQDEASSVVGHARRGVQTGRAMGQLSLDAAMDYLASRCGRR